MGKYGIFLVPGHAGFTSSTVFRYMDPWGLRVRRLLLRGSYDSTSALATSRNPGLSNLNPIRPDTYNNLWSAFFKATPHGPN